MVPPLTTLLTVPLLFAGLLLPGQGWMRALRAGSPWVGGALLSWTSLYLLILGFDVSGIPIRLSTLGIALALETFAGFAFAWSRGWRPQSLRFKRPAHPILLACLLPAAFVLLWKTFAQPLSGPDNVFRWNHLAQLIVTQGSLANYPARSPAEFLVYFWPDGIAPQASALQAWAHLAAGSLDPVWASLPMLLQGCLLTAAIHALGTRLGTRKAGALACLAAGGCFLLQFSVELGQETGLTALGTTLMVLHLCDWDKERRTGLLLAAGCAGALAAAAREYAILLPVVASAWLLIRGAGLRRCLIFTSVALLPASLWFLRNFALTGNPFNNLDFLGLFPVNPVFGAFSRTTAQLYAPDLLAPDWLRLLGRYVVIGALPALPGLLWLVARPRDPRHWLLGALLAGTVFCWLLSLPLTAGGLFYSMRVLSPLLALCAAASGAACAELLEGRPWTRWPLALVTPFLLLDAALWALTIPRNPHTLSPALWLEAGRSIPDEYQRANYQFIEEAVLRSRGPTLCLSPAPLPQYKRHNQPLAPLWSPDLALILDRQLDDQELRSRLRALGYRHLLLSTSALDQTFVRELGLLERLGPELTLVAHNLDYQLYDLP